MDWRTHPLSDHLYALRVAFLFSAASLPRRLREYAKGRASIYRIALRFAEMKRERRQSR